MADQEPGIFRQRSAERITSPEQLTDYLKVTNPGIWLLLASIIFLLCGLFAWSMVGNLETLSDGVAVIENKKAVIMLNDPDGGTMESGMAVRIGSDEYTITTIEYDDFGREVACASIDKTDGIYDVKIVTESVHPIKFLFD